MARADYQTNLPRDMRYFRSSELSERYVLRLLEFDWEAMNTGCKFLAHRALLPTSISFGR